MEVVSAVKVSAAGRKKEKYLQCFLHVTADEAHEGSVEVKLRLRLSRRHGGGDLLGDQ